MTPSPDIVNILETAADELRADFPATAAAITRASEEIRMLRLRVEALKSARAMAIEEAASAGGIK